MGLFKKPANIPQRPGPSYLEGWLKTISDDGTIFKASLVSPDGSTSFRVHYYGQFHDSYQNLIVGTDFAPALFTAMDEASGKDVKLFDGCRDGYNALFCDQFSDAQKARQTDKTYADKKGNTSFEIEITLYYGIDYDEDEFTDELDENGMLELLDGSKMALTQVKRDGFDVIGINVIDPDGTVSEIVEEELA